MHRALTTRTHRRAKTLLLATALLPLATTRALAQESRPDEGTSTASARDDSQKELRRILHLNGGATVRAIARQTATGWEYKSNGAWRAIPAGAVEHVALEKEVLSELRKRKSDIKASERAARAELSGWMFREGLLEEALTETDALLTFDREDARVRELVLANAFRFKLPAVDASVQALPSACSDVLRAGAEATPSMREMIVGSLAVIPDREGLQTLLQDKLFDGSLRSRSFAALALRRMFPGEEIRPLLQRAVLDSSEEVRMESALALRTAGESSLVAPVVRALESSSSNTVRRNAAEALGNMGYPAAVPALVSRLAALQGAGTHAVPHSNIFIGRQFAYLQDFDVEVAQFQAVADPQINVLVEGQVTDAGVVGVQEVDYVTERRVLQDSLGKLTGADPGNYARDWLAWWEQNRGKYEPGQHAELTGGR
jgi:HEAT repeat protein